MLFIRVQRPCVVSSLVQTMESDNDHPPSEPENDSSPSLSTRPQLESDIASTFSLFKDYLDKKLVSLKEDLKEEARSSSDSVLKKLKESSHISFKYEGNKQQHKFNSSLADHVATA